MAVNGRTGIFPHRVDRTTDSNASVDYAHKEVHTGDAFYITYKNEIDDGGLLSARFNASNTTKWVHMTWLIESQASILIELRENITNLLESPFAYNRNRNYSDIATSRFEVYNGTAATAGTVIYSWASGGPAATPSRGASPGLARGDEELVLKANTTYEWRVTSSADNNNISMYFTWYEHANIE